MTAAPEIKGWCPGALRPMLSGDGLVVRIRPPFGSLTPAQAAAIAEAAQTHGNGIIDLSARANLQLRGVTQASHPKLIDDLSAQSLIDPDIETESLRNLIVTPFLDAETAVLAATLTATLTRMPRLPGKFGFALDTGPRPVLTAASADIRVERAADGRLILRPDGLPFGKPITDLAADTLALADWFLASGGVTNGRGRMAALIARGIIPPGCDTAPATPLPQPEPGLHPDGALVALAFGQMQAETLSALAALGHEIRLTPWRMLLLVGATRLPELPGLVTDPADPILRVTACTGAPGCPQALGETRALARSLAARLPEGKSLHVSGCTKGCAHPGVSDLTLVATARGYDLVHGGTAQDTPSHRALMPSAIPDHLPDHTKAPNAPPL
ncbi:precorrin-3B synthase [Tabrizicola piscis]|uniref:Precorrin-3B synthase n=1 Tax=Tabrizicola piscis TaxID=2494374 RepID=A0A3S8U7P4_9RHOB|nr:precorrin-3B synthase [Tabrizicola piscis]AZL59631.1 precorrin-3B synthase [Tabrizicola piscis]